MPEENPSEMIYLNNAATSWPKPPGVRAALGDSLARPVFGSGRTAGSQGDDFVTQAREALTRFFNAGPEENWICTHNATDSLNMLIHGFLAGVEGPCHVITTALDHNSVLRPLYEQEKQGRISLTVVPFENAIVSPDAVLNAIRLDTRLMVMSHGSNVLGSVQDIQAIGEILHEHGVYFIVDGAQTAGHIPVDLGKLPVDAYVFTGHKGLFGVPGTGGFYLRDPDRVTPMRFGGTGTDSFSLFQPQEMPEKFEVGTPNYPGLAALAAGIAFVGSAGTNAIAAKAERQTAYIIQELAKESNMIIYNMTPHLPIVAFNIAGMENDDVGFILARAYGVISRIGLHCAPLVHQTLNGGNGCVRLSLSWFTTDEECRAAANAIREVAANAHSALSQA
ncbi:aminotransferase class V-fold PLP-dependent enzyme [Methanogenium cariaci]|jgi:cysteine desulfurase family protein